MRFNCTYIQNVIIVGQRAYVVTTVMHSSPILPNCHSIVVMYL